MKTYNPALRVDQEAEYRTSVHSKRIAEGDPRPATCISCHGSHDVRAVKDTSSPVYPTARGRHMRALPCRCGLHEGVQNSDRPARRNTRPAFTPRRYTRSWISPLRPATTATATMEQRLPARHPSRMFAARVTCGSPNCFRRARTNRFSTASESATVLRVTRITKPFIRPMRCSATTKPAVCTACHTEGGWL